MVLVGGQDFHPIVLGLLGTLFTWGMTAAGAAVVFFTTKVNLTIMNLFFGFAAGVMLAASCFGLILPAIELSAQQPWSSSFAWLPAAIGFLFGVGFLKLVNYFLPHFHRRDDTVISDVQDAIENNRHGQDNNVIKSCDIEMAVKEENTTNGVNDDDNNAGTNYNRMKERDPKESSWNRTMMLIIAITLHNFPEGLAVGVGFGAASSATDQQQVLRAAMGLALGIGIQNFPEGLSVSMPLRKEGYSRVKAFWYGQLSGAVEPLGGIIGAAAVIVVEPILPFALSFAAGAMVYVVVEELIPESQKGNKNVSTWGTIIGFTIMMVLDVALG